MSEGEMDNNPEDSKELILDIGSKHTNPELSDQQVNELNDIKAIKEVEGGSLHCESSESSLPPVGNINEQATAKAARKKKRKIGNLAHIARSDCWQRVGSKIAMKSIYKLASKIQRS